MIVWSQNSLKLLIVDNILDFGQNQKEFANSIRERVAEERTSLMGRI